MLAISVFDNGRGRDVDAVTAGLALMTEQSLVMTSKDPSCHTRAAKYDPASHGEERESRIRENRQRWPVPRVQTCAESVPWGCRGAFLSSCEQRVEVTLSSVISQRQTEQQRNLRTRGPMLDGGDRRTRPGRGASCVLIPAKVISTA